MSIYSAIYIALVMTTILNATAFECNSCLIGNQLSNNCTVVYQNLFSGYNNTAVVPIQYNGTFLNYQLVYSLTAFPNAVIFSCSGLNHYVGFNPFPGSTLVPLSAQFFLFSFLITQLNDLIITDYPVYQYYVPGLINNFTMPNIYSFQQVNFSALLLSDCTKIGTFPFTVKMNSTQVFQQSDISLTNNVIPCYLFNTQCGYSIEALVNSDCCYSNGTRFNTTYCVNLNTDNYSMNNCTCEALSDPSILNWIISVGVIGPVLFIIIIILSIILCCKTSNRYIKMV